MPTLTTIVVNDTGSGPAADYTLLSTALLSEAKILGSDTANEYDETFKFDVYNTTGVDNGFVILDSSDSIFTGSGRDRLGGWSGDSDHILDIEWVGGTLDPYFNSDKFHLKDFYSTANIPITLTNLQIRGNFGAVPPVFVDGFQPIQNYPFNNISALPPSNVTIENCIIVGKTVLLNNINLVNSLFCGSLNTFEGGAGTSTLLNNAGTHIVKVDGANTEGTNINTWYKSVPGGSVDQTRPAFKGGNNVTSRSCTFLSTEEADSVFQTSSACDLANCYFGMYKDPSLTITDDNLLDIPSTSIVFNCATSDLSAGRPPFVGSNNLTGIRPDQHTFELTGKGETVSTQNLITTQSAVDGQIGDASYIEGSPLIDRGMDTSFESAPFNITTDIGGITRGLGGTWDIGHQEFIKRQIQTFSVGPTGLYSSLADFIHNEAADIDGSGIIKKALLQTFDDTEPVVIAKNWTTSPNDYIWLEAIESHGGIPGSGRSYRHILSTPSGIDENGNNPGINVDFQNLITSQYLRMTGLQIVNEVYINGVCVESSGFSNSQGTGDTNGKPTTIGPTAANFIKERVNAEKCLFVVDPKWQTFPSSGVVVDHVGSGSSRCLKMEAGFWNFSNNLLLAKNSKLAYSMSQGALPTFINNTIIAQSGNIAQPDQSNASSFSFQPYRTHLHGIIEAVQALTTIVHNHSPFIASRKYINNYMGKITRDTLVDPDFVFNVGDGGFALVSNNATHADVVSDDTEFPTDSNLQKAFADDTDVFDAPINDNYKINLFNATSGLFEKGLNVSNVVSSSGQSFHYKMLHSLTQDVLGTARPQVEQNFDIGFHEVPLTATVSGFLGGFLKGPDGGTISLSGVGGYVLAKASAQNNREGLLGGFLLSVPPTNVPQADIGGFLWALPLTQTETELVGGILSSFSGIERTVQLGGFLMARPNFSEFIEPHTRALIKATSDSVFDQTLDVDAKIVFKGRTFEDANARLDIFQTTQPEFNAQLDVQKFKDLPRVFITNLTFDNALPSGSINHLNPSGCRTVTVTASGNLGEGLAFKEAFIDFGDRRVGLPEISISGFTSDPPWTASYKYTSSGIYNITVSARDSRHLYAVDTTTINLASGLVAGVDYPAIDISGVPRAGFNDLLVAFTTAFSGVGAITAVASSRLIWNFGNGLTSNDVAPSSLYANPGHYAPNLCYVYQAPNGSTIKVHDSLLIGFNR